MPPKPSDRVSRRRQQFRRRRILAALALVLLILAVVWVTLPGRAGHRGVTVRGLGQAPATRTRRSSSPEATSAPNVGAGIPVGRWVAQPHALLARTEVSAALVGNVIYVVGGFTSNGRSTAQVERLDLGSGRWSIGVPLPHALNHMSAVGYAGSLYVVGGYSKPNDTSSGAVRAFWRFDPAAGRWKAMPDAPVARGAAGAAVLGHRLYMAGGRNDALPAIGTLAIFNFDTGKWSLGPPLLHPREHVAMVASAGFLWLLGGRILGAGNVADVERYLPGDGAWRPASPMPNARSGFQATAVSGRIITVGGEDGASTLSEVEELDPGTGRWSQLASMPEPRHGLGVIAVGALILAIEGGQQPGLTTSPIVETLRLP